MGQPVRTDLSEVIAENFGANATYVEGMFSRFRSNPELVDESWRAYFTELLGNGEVSPAADGKEAPPAVDRSQDASPTENGRGEIASAGAQASTAKAPAKATTSVAPAPETKPPAPALTEQVEVVPLRGAALKIVENMEASLAVPTATSQRRIPVKLLDENRRIINQHLQENDRGKTSYTHLIAWALLRALMSFPSSTMASMSWTEHRRECVDPMSTSAWP